MSIAIRHVVCQSLDEFSLGISGYHDFLFSQIFRMELNFVICDFHETMLGDRRLTNIRSGVSQEVNLRRSLTLTFQTQGKVGAGSCSFLSSRRETRFQLEPMDWLWVRDL